MDGFKLAIGIKGLAISRCGPTWAPAHPALEPAPPWSFAIFIIMAGLVEEARAPVAPPARVARQTRMFELHGQ